MSYSSFEKFVIEHGARPDEVGSLFNAVSRPLVKAKESDRSQSLAALMAPTISEDEFVLGMVVMDPTTPHEGLPGIVRLGYIFTAYDADGDGVLEISGITHVLPSLSIPDPKY